MNLNHVKEGVEFVLKWEGGYSNDPNDPGGETKYGISKRSYPNVDIKNLTKEQAVEIYYRDYWSKAGCSELDYPFNIAVFDTAVNCGVGRATHWLKKASDVMAYLKFRENHYIELAKQDKLKRYLKGWLNRLGDLRKLVEIGITKAA